MLLYVRFLLLIPFLFFYTGCKQSSDLSSAGLPAGLSSIAGAVNPDAYMEVDCLLPGQVRKLGTMIYASQRRPAKTTANDCSIRGGEYVVFDRANYKQALAIWMVEAESGDPVAQTYVGEIYLKSPKGAPRFDLAAKWFERAAKKGHKRAQVNLGYLYENGLGVLADSEKAARWYSKASGSDLQDIVQREQLTVAERSELEKLKTANATQLAELKKVRGEKKSLESSLREAEMELLSSRKSIKAQQQAIAKKREEMAIVEQQLASKDSAADSRIRQKLRELELGLQKKEADVQRFQQQAQQLSAVVGKHEQKVSSLEASLAKAGKILNDSASQQKQSSQELLALKKKNEAHLAELNQLQLEKSSAEKSLEKLTSQLALTEERAREQREAISQQKSVVKSRSQGMSEEAMEMQRKLETRLAQLRDGLKARETELVEQKRLAVDLATQVSERKSESENYRKTLSQLNTRLANLPGPKIEVLDPQLLRTRGITVARVDKPRNERTITGKVWSPAGLKTLTVNGTITGVEEDGSFRSVVALSGVDQPIVITAVDQNNRKEDVQFTLQKFVSRDGAGSEGGGAKGTRDPSIKFGKYYALVIGNNNYKSLPKLKTAIEDARVVSELLEKIYGFEVTTLYDANRNTILSTLNDFRKRLTENDNFLIYYAGHGTLEERNTQGFWLPVDSALDDDVNWIPTDRVTGIMNLMSAKQIMVVADACYSGIMTRASLTRLESGKSKESYGKWLKKMAAYKSRVIISSGETKPVLDGGGGKHSVFAKALLETLRENTKILLGIDLHRSIAEKVVDASSRMGLDQVPQYAGLNRAGHELGDFLFVPKKRS